GAHPCHIVIDPAGQNALVANYTGGSVAVLPIGQDGALKSVGKSVQHTGSSVHKQRQGEPHAHSINLDAQGKFAIAADLGIDKLLVYKYDAANGTLEPHEPAAASLKPGAGPRHFAFHPNGRQAYVINELDMTVTVFDYDSANGT